MSLFRSCSYLTGFLLFLLTGAVFAHQDRLYSLTADGIIEGLPEVYAPGSLHIAQSEVVLTLGDRERVLPDCLIEVFDLPEREDIRLHGSAHHDLEKFPPYFVIGLPRETIEPGWFNGYEIFFHFESLEILQMDELLVTGEGGAGRVGMTLERRPALRKFCGGDEPRFVPEDS